MSGNGTAATAVGPFYFPRHLFDAEIDFGMARNVTCGNYDNCLDVAIAAGWQGWTCWHCVNHPSSTARVNFSQINFSHAPGTGET